MREMVFMMADVVGAELTLLASRACCRCSLAPTSSLAAMAKTALWTGTGIHFCTGTGLHLCGSDPHNPRLQRWSRQPPLGDNGPLYLYDVLLQRARMTVHMAPGPAKDLLHGTSVALPPLTVLSIVHVWPTPTGTILDGIMLAPPPWPVGLELRVLVQKATMVPRQVAAIVFGDSALTLGVPMAPAARSKTAGCHARDVTSAPRMAAPVVHLSPPSEHQS